MVSASRELKRRFKKSEFKGSLKQFARKLLKELDPAAVAWFEHKSPRWNLEAKESRLKNKGPRIALERAATKSAKRKSKGGGGKTTVVKTI